MKSSCFAIVHRKSSSVFNLESGYHFSLQLATDKLLQVSSLSVVFIGEFRQIDTTIDTTDYD